MGYGIGRFVASIDDNLLCGICSAVLEDAVLTACGHSFCQLCIHTWQHQVPGSSSCPQCRGLLPPRTIPILSVRSLILSLHVHCENNSRGCETILSLEAMRSHHQQCEYSPIQCAGCGEDISRADLAQHHVECSGVLDLCGSSSGGSVSELECRMTGLEIQVKQIKNELDFARGKNMELEVELTRTKEDLELKCRDLSRHQTHLHQNQIFRAHIQHNQNHQDGSFTQNGADDQDYDYGYTPASIVPLACLIARNLLTMPGNLDPHKIYDCVTRCYDKYGRGCGGREHELDILMLLATANASNWFSKEQRVNIQCWLQCLNRHSKYKTESYRLTGSTSVLPPDNVRLF